MIMALYVVCRDNFLCMIEEVGAFYANHWLLIDIIPGWYYDSNRCSSLFVYIYIILLCVLWTCTDINASKMASIPAEKLPSYVIDLHRDNCFNAEEEYEVCISLSLSLSFTTDIILCTLIHINKHLLTCYTECQGDGSWVFKARRLSGLQRSQKQIYQHLTS